MSTANLLKPAALKAGDRIGLVAPSLPIFPNWRPQFELGRQRLESWGFETVAGQHVDQIDWWSAGTPAERAADINGMIADPTIRAIVATSGGFSSIALLDMIDYETLRKNPKPFVGMSDCTLIHLAMLAQTGMVGFHANTLMEGFASHFDDLDVDRQAAVKATYLDALTGMPSQHQLRLTEWQVWRDGQPVIGRLIGGTLKRLVSLYGTPYFPAAEFFDGAILFWEEIGETIYDICYNLELLRHYGILDRLGGMVVGKLTWVNTFFDEIDHPTEEVAVLRTLERYNFPILHAPDFGHQCSMPPLFFGLEYLLDTAGLTFAAQELAVQS